MRNNTNKNKENLLNLDIDRDTMKEMDTNALLEFTAKLLMELPDEKRRSILFR